MSLTNANADPSRIRSADLIEQTPGEPVGRRARACLQGVNVKRSTVRGVARFLVLGMGYLVAFLVTATVPGLSLKLIGSCALFLFIFNLSMVGHDAGHGSLTRSAALNRWIGRLAFLVGYVPFSGWFACHNALHHAFTNLRGVDPFCTPLSKQEYDALSPMRRALYRFYRTFLGVTMDNVLMGLKILLFPGRSLLSHIPRRTAFILERWAALGFLVVQVGGVLAWQQFLEQTWEMPADPVSGLVTVILLPALIMSWWTGLLSFLSHTHPRVRWYADLEEVAPGSS